MMPQQLHDLDHYAIYYADRLWNLLPAVYRAQDSEILDHKGPLRELVDRIGVQGAVLRRSIDRLWEDQSIETCDDWVIAYLADLLDTRLVASLDARAQRLDVCKTIYYRRRAGTVALLEELATDITGWTAKVVEFFHRLSRSRHNLDPPIYFPGVNSETNRILQEAQGLVGPLTRTPTGGFANLHKVYSKAIVRSAFDEFAYTADFRRARGQQGWHNIPRLGVFLWRLKSFSVGEAVTNLNPSDPSAVGVTPIESCDCPGQYTFDPTGRHIPLFAAPPPPSEPWQSPPDWQIPGAISTPLLEKELQNLYATVKDRKILYRSLGVFETQLKNGERTEQLVPADSITINPEEGRFTRGSELSGSNWVVTYHYGFSSTIGAGPFDRRPLGSPLTVIQPEILVTGGDTLQPAWSSLAATGTQLTGTITIRDSLTYTKVQEVTNIAHLTIRSANKTRPLVRLPAPESGVIAEWSFNGTKGSELLLEGLWISGGNIVLKGNFEQVKLLCCTLDPGNAGEGSKAIDGRKLIPCHLRVEGTIDHLILNRCITGPIHLGSGGTILQLHLRDSIVQAIEEDSSQDATEQERLEPGNKEDQNHANLALNVTKGETTLERCTIIGQANLHRLHASECILNDVFEVENTQQGCVRFCAWATGSTLPRQYESVEINPQVELFTSSQFGQPGYAQLQLESDRYILHSRPGASIIAGAQNGSEMGAFAGENQAIKERSLRIKYEEYMPMNLSPVIIYVN